MHFSIIDNRNIGAIDEISLIRMCLKICCQKFLKSNAYATIIIDDLNEKNNEKRVYYTLMNKGNFREI